MATHDYVIDNSTGANVRADINNVLQAILTNNSSSSAPSTTAAYMWWADTTNGVLKIRNSSNNDWVELLQLDGTLTLEDGSASTPGLAFRDDLNTGIFSSAADTFNVATAGVERMELGATTIFNEDGADVDFRIEGDTDANLFYVDAGNNRIGIGTSSPSSLLTVSGATPQIRSVDTDGTNDYSTFQNSSGQSVYNAVDNNTHGKHLFQTAGTERMRIDSSGRLLIGTTSSRTVQGTSILQIEQDNTSLLSLVRTTDSNGACFLTIGKTRNGAVLQDDDVIGVLNFHGDDGTDLATPAAQIRVAVDGTPGSNDMPGRLEFLTTADGASASTERMRIDSSGDIGLGSTTPNLAGYSSPVTSIGKSGNPYAVLELQGTQTSDGAMGLITGYNTSGSSRIATINWNRDGANNSGSLSFETASSGTLGEAMRIDSSGDVLVGTTTAVTDTKLVVDGNIAQKNTGTGTGSTVKKFVVSRDYTMSTSAVQVLHLDNWGTSAFEITAFRRDTASPHGAEIQKLYIGVQGSGSSMTDASIVSETKLTKGSIHNVTYSVSDNNNFVVLSITGDDNGGEAQELVFYIIATGGADGDVEVQ